MKNYLTIITQYGIKNAETKPQYNDPFLTGIHSLGHDITRIIKNRTIEEGELIKLLEFLKITTGKKESLHFLDELSEVKGLNMSSLPGDYPGQGYLFFNRKKQKKTGKYVYKINYISSFGYCHGESSPTLSIK